MPTESSFHETSDAGFLSTFQIWRILGLMLVMTAASPVVAQSPVPCPVGSAVYPCAYVTEDVNNAVLVIDTPKNAPLSTIIVGRTPGGLAVTPDNAFVYVANNSDQTISVINTALGTVTNTISLSGFPTSVAVTPNGKFVYVAEPGISFEFGSFLEVIDTSTNTVTASVPNVSNPTSIAIDPGGSFAYVADTCFSTPNNVGCVDVVDTSTNTITQTVDLSNSNSFEPASIAVTPDGLFLYVTALFGFGATSTTQVFPIDAKSFSILSPLGKGSGIATACPSDLGFVITATGLLYGAFPYDATAANGCFQQSPLTSVYPIDTKTNSVLAPVTVGNGPTGVALSPDGLFVYVTNASDGTLSVINTQTQTVVSTITAGTSVQGVAAMRVAPSKLMVTTTSLPSGVVGVKYNQTLQATGGTPPYTWSVSSGSLPGGLTLSTTGVISGIPTTMGASNFTVQVTDQLQMVATQPLTITILNPLTILTASLPNGTVGQMYNQTLQASGGAPPYTWSVSSGTLPAGLSLTGGGVISGIPKTPGTSTFTVQVTDTQQLSASQQLSITIVNPLMITTTTLPGGTVGISYNQVLQATGGTMPYTWSLSAGSLPPGLSLSGSGMITGIPSASGAYNFTVKVSDAVGLTAKQLLSITIAVKLMIVTASLPDAIINVNYSQMVVAAGGTPPYSWSIVSGNFPPGLILSDLGVISGKPTTTGTFNFTVQVMDAQHVIATQPLRIFVVNQLIITTTKLSDGIVKTTYNQTLQAIGGTMPYTWSISSGTLPPGLILSSTGVVSGLPTTLGTFGFTVQVVDAHQLTTMQPLTIVVVNRLTITTTSLPPGTMGISYNQSLQAAGGTTPYTWSITAGSLPTGLSLSSVGVISGTPSAFGTSLFTVQVTDARSMSATKNLSLVISAVPPLITTQPASQSVTTGQSATLSVLATGTPPLSYQWYQGMSGVTTNPILSATSSSYTTPALKATSDYWVMVSNTAGSINSQTAAITVNQPPICGEPSILYDSGPNTLTVTVTANCTAGQNPIASTTINWGDGSPVLIGTSGTHNYLTAGTYDITTTAIDTSGLSGSATPSVLVTASAPVAIFAGQSTTITVTISGQPSSPSTMITFECISVSGLINGTTVTNADPKTYGITCSSPSAPLTPTVTEPVTIMTTDGGSLASLQGRRGAMYALWLPMPGLIFIGLGVFSPRATRRKLLGYVIPILLATTMLALLGCGGGFTPPPSPSAKATPVATYALTIADVVTSGTPPTAFQQTSLIVPFTVVSAP